MKLTQLASDHATEWYLMHQQHVKRLMEEDIYSYPPSQEDANNPRLWKGAHWNWFINE